MRNAGVSKNRRAKLREDSTSKHLANKSRSAFSLSSVRFFCGWPFWQEAVGIISFLPDAIVWIPYIGKTDDRARLCDSCKCFHRLVHYPALQLRLVGFAGLMPERKIDKHRARRIDCLRNIQSRGHAERWNSGGFDNSRNQSDGLMAHRSGGHQVECVDVGALEFAGNFRRQLGAHLSR
jgi:hypothetical protein